MINSSMAGFFYTFNTVLLLAVLVMLDTLDDQDDTGEGYVSGDRQFCLASKHRIQGDKKLIAQFNTYWPKASIDA